MQINLKNQVRTTLKIQCTMNKQRTNFTNQIISHVSKHSINMNKTMFFVSYQNINIMNNLCYQCSIYYLMVEYCRMQFSTGCRRIKCSLFGCRLVELYIYDITYSDFMFNSLSYVNCSVLFY